MQKLTAIKEFRYGGAQRFPGDQFDASDKDAKLLAAVGRAEIAKPRELPRHIETQRATVKKMEAEDEAPKSEPGRYLRRDMQAEGGQTGEVASRSSSQADQAPAAPSKQRGKRPGRPAGLRSKKT